MPARKTTTKKPAKKTAAKKTTTTKKTTAKKPAVKAKTATRKTTTPKTTTTKKPAPLKVIKTKPTKTQVFKTITENLAFDGIEVSQKMVAEVFKVLKEQVNACMKKGGCGEFIVPELGVKIRRIKKKATKARMGRNPMTGEEVKIAAKPARTVVKVTALKALKESIDG